MSFFFFFSLSFVSHTYLTRESVNSVLVPRYTAARGAACAIDSMTAKSRPTAGRDDCLILKKKEEVKEEERKKKREEERKIDEKKRRRRKKKKGHEKKGGIKTVLLAN